VCVCVWSVNRWSEWIVSVCVWSVNRWSEWIVSVCVCGLLTGGLSG